MMIKKLKEIKQKIKENFIIFSTKIKIIFLTILITTFFWLLIFLIFLIKTKLLFQFLDEIK